MLERFKKLKFAPAYEISNLGNIKHGDKILKPTNDARGYLKIVIDGHHYKIHRLVAMHFKRNPDDKPIVNHKNGNKKDNRASNLEWVTQSENVQHAWKKGLIKRGKSL